MLLCSPHCPVYRFQISPQPVLYRAALTILLELIDVAQVAHAIPDWPDSFVPLSPLPFTIAGASLSLLLVFRTNASYGRWDEARKMWGLMVSLMPLLYFASSYP